MNKADQRIGCTVESCVYNEQGHQCSLQAITVAPCQMSSSGRPEDESMCADYKAK